VLPPGTLPLYCLKSIWLSALVLREHGLITVEDIRRIRVRVHDSLNAHLALYDGTDEVYWQIAREYDALWNATKPLTSNGAPQ
jgi:hypothetical protein